MEEYHLVELNLGDMGYLARLDNYCRRLASGKEMDEGLPVVMLDQKNNIRLGKLEKVVHHSSEDGTVERDLIFSSDKGGYYFDSEIGRLYVIGKKYN